MEVVYEKQNPVSSLVIVQAIVIFIIFNAAFEFLEFVTGTKQKKDNSLYAVNELDLADALEKLKANDASLTDLNINNHKDINELNALKAIIECIPSNTHLKVLCMANTQMHDRHAKVSLLLTNNLICHQQI